MRRAHVPLILAAALTAPAFSARAGEPPAKPKRLYVDLQTIGLPAVIQGRLVNYIFVQLRLDVAPGVDASKIQLGEPYLRDALVRSISRTPLNEPDNGVKLDDARLKAAVMKASAATFGPGKVTGVEVITEAPQKWVHAPRPTEPKGDPPPA